MKKSKITIKKSIVIFIAISILLFTVAFIFNKEFRFNIAVRFIALTNFNPFCERIYSVNTWDNNIIINKKVYYKCNYEGDITDYVKKYKMALYSSLKINEAIYELQRNDFWCDSVKAVYINSDSYLKNPATTISVGTGQGSYAYYLDNPNYKADGKWAIVRYMDMEEKKEFEAIVSEYDGYEFKIE